MTTFAKNLRVLLHNNDLTQKKFADSIHVTLTTVSGWLNRDVHPSCSSLSDICHNYGVSMKDLISEDEGLYARLHTPQPASPALPVVGGDGSVSPLMNYNFIAVTNPQDGITSNVALPTIIRVNHPHGYFVVVPDNSMNRVLPCSSFAFIDPTKHPENGSVALLSIDGNPPKLRRYFRGANTIVLAPDSDSGSYTDSLFSSDEEERVHILGTLVWFQCAQEMA